MPSGWLKDVPRRGVISFYYCREQRVIEHVFEKGGWAGDGQCISHNISCVYHLKLGCVFRLEVRLCVSTRSVLQWDRK